MGETPGFQFTRRALLSAAVAGSAGLLAPGSADADDDELALIERLIGGVATPSDRVRLTMPSVFPNGYTVPLAFQIEAAMTETDHVRKVIVLAPQNPIVEVAAFHFVVQRSEPRISTRIRLAKPQNVFAVAQMNDGALLMAKTWVEVATNGCS